MESVADILRIKPSDNRSKQTTTTDWDRAKLELDELPNDYMSVFKKVHSERPYEIKKHKISKGYEFSIDLKPLHGYEAMLNFVEIQGKNIQRAWYILFDNKNSVSYIRDVLKNPSLV